MLKLKKIFTFAFILLLLSGCGTALEINTKSATPPQDKVVETTKNKAEEKTSEVIQKNIINKKIIKEKNMDKQTSYSAILHTTEGDITIKLNDDQTPKTVENFVTLSKKDFYKDVIFHRVIKGFMIQGGDPTGTGAGGPGYKFDDEPFTGEYNRGTVAMANAGPNTNGSQFFIMHADVPLPKNYTIFGQVIEGLETVDKIAEAEVIPGGEGSSPVEPVKITSVEIIEN
jgi:cyclophilin family peptidyl-prolyl cis-trans isomerase